MKLLLKLIGALLLSSNVIFSQDLEGGDVWVTNLTSHNRTIYVRVYPVSMVFNKPFPIWQNPGNYDLHAKAANENFNYINGRGIAYDTFILLPNEQGAWNMEGITTSAGGQAGLGRGTYKFEFSWIEESLIMNDTLIVE
jgi:hypothetical protein